MGRPEHDAQELAIWAAVSSEILHLTLLPTEACNFRCVYCYESFQLGRMPASVVAGIKNHLRRRMADLKTLHISWFGGEPLLAFEIIEEIGSYVQTLRASAPQVTCHSDITTNAFFMSPEIFGRLCNLGVNQYQISFDGEKTDHDQSRIQANGGPTFDRIWDNLIGMQKSAATFTALVRLHLDANNVRNVPRFKDSRRIATSSAYPARRWRKERTSRFVTRAR